jgi:hypothetical protein
MFSLWPFPASSSEWGENRVITRVTSFGQHERREGEAICFAFDLQLLLLTGRNAFINTGLITPHSSDVE